MPASEKNWQQVKQSLNSADRHSCTICEKRPLAFVSSFFVAAVVKVVVDVEVVLFVVVVFVVVVVVVVAVVVVVVSVFFFNLNICQFKSLRAAPDLAEIEDATKRTKRRNNDFFFSTKKSRERESSWSNLQLVDKSEKLIDSRWSTPTGSFFGQSIATDRGLFNMSKCSFDLYRNMCFEIAYGKI